MATYIDMHEIHVDTLKYTCNIHVHNVVARVDS